MRCISLTVGVVAGLGSLAQAQFAFVVDSGGSATSERVMLVDAFDGTVLDSTFIDVAGQTGGAAGTIQEILEVNGELWLSDQSADRIWRFDQAGQLLGDVGVGSLNNIRGMELVGNTLFVGMGSDGADGTAAGLVRIDVNSGQILGSTAGGASGDISYWDVLRVGDELFVGNIDGGNDAIERFDLSGNFLGTFASSDGDTSFDFAQQLAISADGERLLLGGFSPPAGVFAIDLETGESLGIVSGLDAGPRGVFELGNGEILWGNGTFLSTALDVANADDPAFLRDIGGSYRFITATSIPAPAAAGALAAACLFTARRRR